ncbi:cyclic nucleotide-gated ion channel 1-like [Mangifera indica]|uniref:cyclic nucleotide-gated ion channel 1-like n=1 Tax=Mangifera indica TaxID=29780 RepID=UPI001CFAF9F6|nr:cyclic nucleotide-gated ion channel 1-like [Mangifera indica]
MTESLLNDLCDLLKAMIYTEDSYFVREGDPVDEMLFVMKGKLSSVAADGGTAGFYNAHYARDGDCFGDADDLKFVVSQFRPATKQQEHLYSYYAGSKISDAARLIQKAWQAYKRRKLEEALLQEEEIGLHLQDEWFKPRGNSSRSHASSSDESLFLDLDPHTSNFTYYNFT